jgi:hypothetical protein
LLSLSVSGTFSLHVNTVNTLLLTPVRGAEVDVVVKHAGVPDRAVPLAWTGDNGGYTATDPDYTGVTGDSVVVKFRASSQPAAADTGTPQYQVCRPVQAQIESNADGTFAGFKKGAPVGRYREARVRL